MNIYINHFPVWKHAWEITEVNTTLQSLGIFIEINSNCLENPIQ